MRRWNFSQPELLTSFQASVPPRNEIPKGADLELFLLTLPLSFTPLPNPSEAASLIPRLKSLLNQLRLFTSMLLMPQAGGLMAGLVQ